MKRLLFTGMLLAAVMTLPALQNTSAQEKTAGSKPADTHLAFSYLCTSNDSVSLTANLFIKKESEVFGLMNATVSFFSSLDNAMLPLGSVVTDQDGNAVLVISTSGLKPDNNGMISYTARFEGHKKYSGSSGSLSAEPAKLRMTFNIQDSVRYLNVNGTRKDAKGQDQALQKETVILYVPRLFSLLKIGEVSLDENGKGSFEFPNDIVGDTLGNLKIIAKIEENEKYGFVQGSANINWGVPKQYYKAEVPSRELWTPIAPLWMVITLVIMLAGVWAHYFYAVWELIMIKRSGKNNQPPY
jgi:hypothetical protein